MLFPARINFCFIPHSSIINPVPAASTNYEHLAGRIPPLAALPCRRLVRPSNYAHYCRASSRYRWRCNTKTLRIRVRRTSLLSIFKDKRQFIFLTSVLGLGLVLSISGFVVLRFRTDLEPWQPWTLLAVGLMLIGLLLGYTGIRRGETLGLRHHDLNLEFGNISIVQSLERSLDGIIV